MRDNGVHALVGRIEDELGVESAPPCPVHLIQDQTDWYMDMVIERQKRGWKQPRAEEELGLWDPKTDRGSVRHLTHIEPARQPDWRKKKHLRLPFKLTMNDTAMAMMAGYGRVLVLMDWSFYRDIEAGTVKPRPALTSQQRNNIAERARIARLEAEEARRRADVLEAAAEAQRLSQAAVKAA